MARIRIGHQEVLAPFVLPRRGGGTFDSVELRKKKSLALFFLSHPAPSFLVGLEDAAPQMRRQGAEVVVVCPCGAGVLEELHRKHRLTVPFLADEERRFFDRCVEAGAQESVCGLVVTDRTGTVYFSCAGAPPNALPPWEEINKAIAFVESQYARP
jgi:peroxiredoxin